MTLLDPNMALKHGFSCGYPHEIGLIMGHIGVISGQMGHIWVISGYRLPGTPSSPPSKVSVAAQVRPRGRSGSPLRKDVVREEAVASRPPFGLFTQTEREYGGLEATSPPARVDIERVR